MYCRVGLAFFNIWRIKKRLTLLSNSNPLSPQESVPLPNVINDKSNQFISLHITFSQKIAQKRLLHTTMVKSKHCFVDIQPPKPIMRQYPSNSRVSELKNYQRGRVDNKKLLQA